MVIAVYRPKPGKDAELLERMREHLPVLRQEGLVTDRPSIMMRAKDGTILEVFEWKSAAHVERAHTNPAVLAMWERFGKVCDYGRLADLAEVGDMFAHFEPIDL